VGTFGHLGRLGCESEAVEAGEGAGGAGGMQAEDRAIPDDPSQSASQEFGRGLA
jgi:hypothetical protein